LEDGDEVNKGAVPKALMLWGFSFMGTDCMARVVFVIGGARSGKSAFALARAEALPGRKIYVATAQAYDAEMVDRIDKHQSERGNAWETHEEPVRLGQAVRTVSATHDIAVIDCLTIWLSNLLCSEGDVQMETEDFLDALGNLRGGSSFFVVANEVGMGIVPENALARQFRDIAGKMNQQVAQVADEVFLVAAGIPVKIK
jgi:adenosylcobinamide kinase / adenosylcobinamide-phosphate guanylyltransferase